MAPSNINTNENNNDVVHLHCICGRRHQSDVICTQCDKCDEWYYVRKFCLGVKDDEPLDDFVFFCNNCRTNDTITGSLSNGIDKIDAKEGLKNKVTRATYDDENTSNDSDGSENIKTKKVTPTKMAYDDIEDGDDEDLLFSNFKSSDEFSVSTPSSNISRGSSRKKKRVTISNITSPIPASNNRKNSKRKSDNLESFEFDDIETKSRKEVEITPTTNDATTVVKIDKFEFDNMVESLKENKTSLISFKKESNLVKIQNKELKDINEKLLSESSKLKVDIRIAHSKISKWEKTNKIFLADEEKLKKESEEACSKIDELEASINDAKSDYANISASLEESKASLKLSKEESHNNKNHYETATKALQNDNGNLIFQNKQLKEINEKTSSENKKLKKENQQTSSQFRKLETNYKTTLCNLEESNNNMIHYGLISKALQTDNGNLLCQNTKLKKENEDMILLIETKTMKEKLESKTNDDEATKRLNEINNEISSENNKLKKENQITSSKLRKLETNNKTTLCNNRKLKQENHEAHSKIKKLEANISNARTKHERVSASLEETKASLKSLKEESNNNKTRNETTTKVLQTDNQTLLCKNEKLKKGKQETNSLLQAMRDEFENKIRGAEIALKQTNETNKKIINENKKLKKENQDKNTKFLQLEAINKTAVCNNEKLKKENQGALSNVSELEVKNEMAQTRLGNKLGDSHASNSRRSNGSIPINSSETEGSDEVKNKLKEIELLIQKRKEIQTTNNNSNPLSNASPCSSLPSQCHHDNYSFEAFPSAQQQHVAPMLPYYYPSSYYHHQHPLTFPPLQAHMQMQAHQQPTISNSDNDFLNQIQTMLTNQQSTISDMLKNNNKNSSTSK